MKDEERADMNSYDVCEFLTLLALISLSRRVPDLPQMRSLIIYLYE